MPEVQPNSAQAVAHRAGVSVSTVSRVLNSHPSVSEKTAKLVRQAMEDLSFRPSRRTRASRGPTAISPRDTRISFVIFGATDAAPAPSFHRLLYGVSKGADALGVQLNVSFLPATAASVGKLLDQRPEGLLLHGLQPPTDAIAPLAGLPTVWLMGNRTRPAWGDQVMPDNTAIGTLGGNYLLARGHQRVAYIGFGGWSWSFGIRALAFTQACRDLGGEVVELIANASSDDSYWGGDLPRAADEIVERLLALPQPPTGLFVSEDRLLPVVQAALIDRGASIIAPSTPPSAKRAAPAFEILSCNNDARFLPLRGPVPPSIDIGAETIGRQGIEHLLWRMAHRGRVERLRIMIAPTLVEPPVT